MKNKALTWSILVGLAFFVSLPGQVLAQATGNIVGSLIGYGSGSYSANATDPATGRSRDVPVAADGTFRFAQLPVGRYDVSVSSGGKVVARDSFDVSLNGNVVARFELTRSAVEEIVVTAASVTGDIYSTDSGLVINAENINVLPVAQNVTSISLLAPGVILGDTKFDLNGSPGYASFGGSSVAENSCYINGLEVTNTRQGLGCGAVPYQFYQQFQVKTGGYSAQYGRTTGGVLNAVTKSGTNQWEFGLGLAVEPESQYASGNVSRGNGGLGNNVGGLGTGRVFRDTTQDANGLTEYWASVSGPLIKDKLFIYAIANPRDSTQNFSWQTGSRVQYARDDEFRRMSSSGSDNLFWGTKIDWDVTSSQRLSYFAYSNRNDTTDVHYPRNPITNVISNTSNQTIIRNRGGEAHSFSYTGTFFHDLTVSAMRGDIKTEYTSNPDDTVRCPKVSDQRTPAPAAPIVGCGPGGSYGADNDDNTQTRLDVQWSLRHHRLRLGLDKQERQSTKQVIPIGGHEWTYSTLAANGVIQGNSGPIYTNTGTTPVEFVFDRIFTNAGSGGGFSSDLTAYYVEDEWQVNNNIVLYLGTRKDNLKNVGVTGITFAEFKQDWAPRLGVSWDPTGKGRDKIFSTWGRYYLPVPNNTNYRLASGVSDTTVYYRYTGVDATTGQPTGFTPISGALGTSTVVNSIAAAPTKDEVQAREADPFYKNEFILGYGRQLSQENSAEIRAVYRDVGATLDDYCGVYANPGYCTLVNPGSGGSWADAPGAPVVYYTAAQIGLPKGQNKYTALQLQFNHASDRLNYTALYVWSRSIGNFEGAVKSDIIQKDAGITQDFDFPALMDGAYGYLPNDRRHVFKFYGSYQMGEHWTAGWNSSVATGRPLTAFGSGYFDLGANVFGSYGDTYYLYTNQCPDLNGNGTCDQSEKIYQFTGRGNNGRTPLTMTFDASLTYAFKASRVGWVAGLQVFNLFNIQEITSIDEHAEARRSEGRPNEWFGATYGWQTPRYLRLSLEARF